VCNEKKKGYSIGYILCRNCLLKHSEKKIEEEYKWREDKEEDVSSYWVTLRKRQSSQNLKTKQLIALRTEIAVAKVVRQTAL
jgi:hypothetical protein